MSRYKPLLEHSSSDRIELKRIVQNPLSDPDLVLRARAILSFLDGSKGDAISKELNVRPNTVSDWRKRYVEAGVEGLYTRAPKGKRGSETRNKVLETLETQTSTKALAEAVGTSVDTVRRALRDSCIWNREIQRGPAMAYVDVVGLYMAKEEAGLIIRVDSQMSVPSSGVVTTHNRELAQRLDQTDNDLSLADAISASIQAMKEVYRGSREGFQDFAARIFKDEGNRVDCGVDDGSNSGVECGLNKTEGRSYHYIYYWYDNSNVVNPILQESSVIVRATEDIDVWFGMIEPWITLSQNITGKDAGSLVSLICFYMKKTTVFVEPFEWRRTTDRRGFVG